MNPADYKYNYGRDMPIEPDIFISLIERLGVPICTLIACGYLISWLLRNASAERLQWQQRDELNDERIMKLVESSSDALLHVKIALEANTQAMREFIRYRRNE